MSDETSPAGGQSLASGQPQSGAPNTSDQRSDGNNKLSYASVEEALKEIERLQKRVHETSQEAGEHRNAKKALETKLKAYEDAQLSESEKKDKALSEAQQAHATAQERLQRLTVRAAVLELAPELGINPKLAARLIDWSSLKIDEEGNPTNIDKVLAALLQEFPQIAAQQPSAQQQQSAPRQQVPPSNPQRSSGNGLSGQSPRNISWSEAFKKQG